MCMYVYIGRQIHIDIVMGCSRKIQILVVEDMEFLGVLKKYHVEIPEFN